MSEEQNDNDIAALRREVAELKASVGALQVSVTDLVEAWRAGKSVLAIVKWAAALGSAIAIIWSVIHGGGQVK